jgi:hypothetical protein
VRWVILFLSALSGLAGCDRSPVAWRESTPMRPGWPVDAAGERRLALDSSGEAYTVAAPSGSPPARARACPQAVAARAATGELYVAWWASRADSSVTLQVMRSGGGVAGADTAVTADARDVGRRGCARPAPSIAVDPATGYVHLAYFLEPAEGAGVWLTHSMERGAIWHAPVPIIFGPDPALARVTALRDTVLVAFESPNEREGWIGLAFSSTDGHLIDWTIPAVSGGSVRGRDPAVARDGRRIAVAWLTGTGGSTMARTGTLRTP